MYPKKVTIQFSFDNSVRPPIVLSKFCSLSANTVVLFMFKFCFATGDILTKLQDLVNHKTNRLLWKQCRNFIDKCSWRWMGGEVSRSISPQWNHKAAMHGPWEAPRCSAGIAINQPTMPSKYRKKPPQVTTIITKPLLKGWAWQHTSQGQQHPNT